MALDSQLPNLELDTYINRKKKKLGDILERNLNYLADVTGLTVHNSNKSNKRQFNMGDRITICSN